MPNSQMTHFTTPIFVYRSNLIFFSLKNILTMVYRPIFQRNIEHPGYFTDLSTAFSYL